MPVTDLFARIGAVIFGGTAAEPADSIDAGLLEQVVDAVAQAVDPRLLLMPRYRKRLAPSAARSIRVLRSMAPRLPDPIELSRAAWSTDAHINALFATASDVQTLVDRSAPLRAFFAAHDHCGADAAYAILGTRREERNVLAPALVDGELRRDVAQTTVGFTAHTLVAIAADASSMRAMLGEGILQRLAGLALERIVALRDRTAALETRKSMLATRLRMLELRRGRLQQLATDGQDASVEIATLTREFAATAEDHKELKTSLATLDHAFEQIAAVLGDPERHLGLNTIELRVSHTGYKLDASSREPAAELRLNELWIGSSLVAVIVPVRIPRPAL